MSSLEMKEIKGESDTVHHDIHSDKCGSMSCCLLCGSFDEGSYEMETGNRDKWTSHFCQLFRVDECPSLAQTTKAEMWTTMQSALYCSDCMDSLERISHLLQTIEDINAQLRVIQLQCEAKLRAAKQNLHDPQEVKRRRSLWTCLRVGEGRLGGISEVDAYVTLGLDMDAESRSNSPASPLSLAQVDLPGDEVSKECSLLDPRTQRHQRVKMEKSEEPSELREDEGSDSASAGDEKVVGTGEEGEGTSEDKKRGMKKSGLRKGDDGTRNDYEWLKAQYNLRDVHVAVEKLATGVEDEEGSEAEEDRSAPHSDFSSSDSSEPAAPVRRKGRVGRKKRPQKRQVSADSAGSAVKRPRGRPRSANFVPRRAQPRPRCPFAPECKRVFNTDKGRDEHVMLVHEGKKHACEICGQTYSDVKQLAEHGNIHEGLTPFKCDECPREFSMSQQLKYHRYKFHGDKLFKCHACDKTFASEDTFNKHQDTPSHRERANIVTERERQRKEDLLAGKPRPYQHKPKNYIHKCPFPNCDKVYATVHSLRTHELTHDETVRASLTCSFCLRVYGSKHILQRHVAIKHTGDVRFRCELCPFITTNRITLHRHTETVHTNKRPLQCDLCGHTFKHAYYLRQHQQRYHPKTKDHMCSICGKCFSNKRYLQEHDETHKEIKSFLCTHCGRGFTQRTSLNKHMRSVHKIPKAPSTIKMLIESAEPSDPSHLIPKIPEASDEGAATVNPADEAEVYAVSQHLALSWANQAPTHDATLDFHSGISP